MIYMEGENMRKIPLKNYFILLLVIIVSMIALLYLINFYKVKKEYDDNSKMVMSFLKEIHIDDFENYIIENPEVVIYIGYSNNNKMIETELKKYIIEKDYTQDIVYINSKDNNKKVLKVLQKYLNNDLNMTKIPNILLIKNGKINNTYYIDENSDIAQITEFMELYYND